MMESHRVLVSEYDAVSETNEHFKIQKHLQLMVNFHSDGTRQDIPGRTEYHLRSGEPLTVLDDAHPDEPELFERSLTHEHLRVVH